LSFTCATARTDCRAGAPSYQSDRGRRFASAAMTPRTCASSQQLGLGRGRVARRSLVCLGSCFAAGARVCLGSCFPAGARERSALGIGIVRGRTASAAARFTGLGGRLAGGAGVAFAAGAGGATSFASPSQQVLGPSSGVVSWGAPAVSVLARVPSLGTDTETSTLAVVTETSTVPADTFTETVGMLTLT
jgi:hypothetical protein